MWCDAARCGGLARWVAFGCSLLLVGCAALVGGAPRFSQGQSNAGPIPITEDDVIIGEPDAPLTFVAFLNYERTSSRYVLEALEELRHRSPSDVRYVVRHAVGCGDPYARSAAIAAEAVLRLSGPKAQWEFQKALLAYPHLVGPEFIRKVALEVGVDESQLEQLDDEASAKRVDRDLDLWKQLDLGHRQVTLLNGLKIEGYPSQEKLDELIRAEKPHIEALRAAGATAREIYAARVAKNVAVWEKIPAMPERAEPYAIPVDNSPSLGPPSAPVTLVQFADLGSHCSKVLQPKIAHLRSKYGDKLRVVFKHIVWWAGRGSATLAQHARKAGGDPKFFAAVDLLWKAVPHLHLARFEQIAVELGLNPQETLRAITDDHYAEVIDRDDALGNDLHVLEPTVFINGRRAPTFEVADLEGLVDAELAAGDRAGTSIVAAAPEPLVAPADLPYRGPRDAPVTVHMFASYRNAACSVPLAVDKLFLEHPGQIKLVFWPLMPKDGEKSQATEQRGTEAALEAHAQHGGAGFWHASKLLCRRLKIFYEKSEREANDKDEIHAYNRRINLDIDRLQAALADHRHWPRVEAALAVAKARNIEETTFVFEGVKLARGHSVRRLVLERLKTLDAAAAPSAAVPEAGPSAAVPAPLVEGVSAP